MRWKGQVTGCTASIATKSFLRASPTVNCIKGRKISAAFCGHGTVRNMIFGLRRVFWNIQCCRDRNSTSFCSSYANPWNSQAMSLKPAPAVAEAPSSCSKSCTKPGFPSASGFWTPSLVTSEWIPSGTAHM